MPALPLLALLLLPSLLACSDDGIRPPLCRPGCDWSSELRKCVCRDGSPGRADSPPIVLQNLERAFDERDKDLYETLIDTGFVFTEVSCAGDTVYRNDYAEELRIIGPRDGSAQGVFDFFGRIDFVFRPIGRSVEGADEVFAGKAEILLLSSPRVGHRVDQEMRFTLRRGSDDRWRILHWHDHAWGCKEGS